ncbi:hypothetical protein EDB19DRAFT_1823639 [Suillus lakei]|nr:hypothetical protein EDB19DRAFT_1823639 [Suillus lakei]
MGSIFSAIGGGINAIISAIARVIMTIVGAITTVYALARVAQAGAQAGAQVEVQGAVVSIRRTLDVVVVTLGERRGLSERFWRYNWFSPSYHRTHWEKAGERNPWSLFVRMLGG